MKNSSRSISIFNQAFLCIFFASILFISSCISAEKAYSKGNYEKAYSKSLNKLEKDSKDRKHRKILINSLDNIIRDTEKEAQQTIKREPSVGDFKSVQRNITSSLEYIEDAKEFTETRFDNQELELEKRYDEFQQLIADYYFVKGLEDFAKAENNDSKKSYQDAYYHFENAEKYDTNFVGIHGLKDTCLLKGIYHIRVNATGTFEIMHQWDIDQKFDDVTGNSNRFRKVYFEQSPTELDCIINVDLRSLDINDTENSRIENFTERIQDGTTTETDTAGNTTQIPKYVGIEGQVEIITARRIARWQVDIDIQKVSKHCTFSGSNFTESEESQIEKYELSGDKRAIPDRFDVTFPDELPDEDDLADILIERIYNRFVSDYF